MESDGSIPLHPVRGSHLISQFAPKKGTIDHNSHRSAYTRKAIELVAMPGYYQHILQEQGILVEPTPSEQCRYDRPLTNITSTEVASFFASQGVMLAQVNDTWEFAVNWIQDVISNPAERDELLNNIDSVVDFNGVEPPSSHPHPEQDWWRPLGYVAPELPPASTDAGAARTDTSSNQTSHRETVFPASTLPSMGGGSESDASSSARPSFCER